mgnify:CR=1 FL=1
MQNRSFLGTLLTGMVALFVLIPWVSLSLRNEHVNVNGIVVDGIEVIQDLMRRSLSPSPSNDGGEAE